MLEKMFNPPYSKSKNAPRFQSVRLEHSRQLWAAEPLQLTEIEEIHPEKPRAHSRAAMRITSSPGSGD